LKSSRNLQDPKPASGFTKSNDFFFTTRASGLPHLQMYRYCRTCSCRPQFFLLHGSWQGDEISVCRAKWRWHARTDADGSSRSHAFLETGFKKTSPYPGITITVDREIKDRAGD
jgi:hypothetical protein